MNDDALECHECPALCEKVVYPAACLAADCRYLYAFREADRTFFGCIEKVFRHEIDLASFQELERTKGGFGVVRMARPSLENCAVAVQSCYQGVEVPVCRNAHFRRRDRRPVESVEE